MFQRPDMDHIGFIEINDNRYYVEKDGLRSAYQEEVAFRNYQLTVLDVKMLVSLLGEELCRHALKEVGEGSSALDMWVGDVCIGHMSGPVNSFQILVDGPYFNRREGISLEPSGYFGFAGWADSCNEKPFLVAFARWMDEWLLSPDMRALDAWVDEVRDELYWRRTHEGKGGGRDE